MNTLLLVFGKRISYHYEALFAIESILAHSTNAPKIHIYTDAPEFYKFIESKITIHLINPDLIREWKGPYNCPWREKMKTVQDLSLKYPDEPLLYLDSDTFAYRSFDEFEQFITNGQAFMHLKETVLSKAPNKTGRRLWSEVHGQTYAGVKVPENVAMWNAGVLGLPVNKQKETIETAIRICDELCEKQVKSWLIEQFSWSLALQTMHNLHPANAFIGHYWGNKDQWDNAIQQHLLSSHLQSRNFEEEVDAVKSFDFKSIPIKLNPKLGRQRLIKRLEKWLPDRMPEYL